MVKTIIFDNEASFWWSDNYDSNRMLIESTTRWLYDLFNTRGYMYLNDIYERFGVKWDPHEPNECFIKDSNEFMLSWECLKNNVFKITVYY